MILHIPVRKTTVRIDGANRDCLELANGFVTVSFETTAIGNREYVSNPLTEVFQDLYNRGILGAAEKVQIVLEEYPAWNGENDDNLLNHLDQIV